MILVLDSFRLQTYTFFFKYKNDSIKKVFLKNANEWHWGMIFHLKEYIPHFAKKV